MDSAKTPTERIRDLERQVAGLQEAHRVIGAYSIMLLEQTLEQVVGERLLPAESAREIWRRISEKMDESTSGLPKLAGGAKSAMPRSHGITRSGPPRTHREKLRLRMRQPDPDQ